MNWVALIPLLPALSFFVLWPMPRKTRNASRFVAVGAIAISMLLSFVTFFQVLGTKVEEGQPVWTASYKLGELGGIPFVVGFHVDHVTAIMLLVVTIVGLAVTVYSLGYMEHEHRKGWYFAALSLFNAAMLTLVLSNNFLLLYMAWEVMGLCSYLLIGFWHEREEARLASIKAFLTTRVGDVAFAIGLAVMWSTMHSFEFSKVLPPEATWAQGAATAVAMLFLLGAMGKSAQVPFHVWLPDAMAGPTPASATIHAATMVAAGVYLVARALPIFEVAAPWVLTVVVAVGCITLLVGGLLAVVQYDIKKVLAYSTISQLGYMFVALGAGSEMAGLYHLTTHAFFKSLLFLSAGVIIHAAHTQDIREMSGLWHSLKWTRWIFTIGALALVGVIPFSGFFSKDEILATLINKGLYVPFAAALLGALITAYYNGRVWFRVMSPGRPCKPEKAHEGSPTMVGPTAAYAAITMVLGFGVVAFATFLGDAEVHFPWESTEGWVLIATSTITVALGIAAAWYVYGRKESMETEALKKRLQVVYAAFTNKFYFDAVYHAIFIKPYFALSEALSNFDKNIIDGIVNGAASAFNATANGSWTFDGKVIDGAVNGAASLVKETGARARRLQVGRLQSYQRFMFAAIVVFFVLTFAILTLGAK